MASKQNGRVLNFVAWLTGVIVSLAVGFAMLPGGALAGGIPYVGTWLTTVAGWIVIVTTLLSVVLALIKH